MNIRLFHSIASPAILMLLAVPVLIAGCAGNPEKSKEMETHFAEMEAQQLRELESDEEARQLAMRAPPKPVSEFDIRENEKNQRYQDALAAAEKRASDDNPDPGQLAASQSQPARAAQGWQLGSTVHPVSGTTICAIESKPEVIDNGGLKTEVRIIVTPGAIFLRTDATLDTRADQASMQVDGGPLFVIESYANEVTGLIEDQYRPLLIQLALGDKLSVVFRYEPHRVEAQNHQFELGVKDFAGYLDGLKNC